MPQINNYPGGFASGVSIRGVPLVNTHPGKVFWVNNSTVVSDRQVSGSNGNNGTFDKPFATVAYALSQCTAGRGDIVFVKPSHAETIAAATDWSKAGVAVVGLGSGANRPTFSFSATASKITLTATTSNDMMLHNLLFISTIDAVVNVLNVAGSDVTLSDLEYREDTAVQCTDCIIAVATATRFKVRGFKYRAFDTTAGTVAGIALVGMDSPEISQVDAIGLWSAGFIDCRTTAVTNLNVFDCRYRSLGTGEVFVKDTITASTGMIGPNLMLRLSANAANITEAITGATFVVQDNVYVVNNANEKGMLINWTASTDA